MINYQQMIIDAFVVELKRAYQQTYNDLEPGYGNLLEWTGRLALELISNSDALYHDMEHTMMVGLVGQSILKGRHLQYGGVTPRDWLHYMIALLCHDIGYVRGICQQDRPGEYASGVNGGTVQVSVDSTDAALTPYHVDRSKLFVQERFGGRQLIEIIDVEIVQSYIEMTRFPIPTDPYYQDTTSYRGLARAADFIGQLGDPNYLRKLPALYYEFVDIGTAKSSGYDSPGHMRRNFTRFYWNIVRPHIQEALECLRVTQEGKQWIANLHSHVFEVEHNEL